MMDRYDERGNPAPNGRYVLWGDHAQVAIAAKSERLTLLHEIEGVLDRLDDLFRLAPPNIANILYNISSQLAFAASIDPPEDSDSPEHRADMEIERELDRRMEEGRHE